MVSFKGRIRRSLEIKNYRKERRLRSGLSQERVEGWIETLLIEQKQKFFSTERKMQAQRCWFCSGVVRNDGNCNECGVPQRNISAAVVSADNCEVISPEGNSIQLGFTSMTINPRIADAVCV